MKRDRNTEQDIIEAAQKVFQEKGFKEATMRDIASEANINMAMALLDTILTSKVN